MDRRLLRCLFLALPACLAAVLGVGCNDPKAEAKRAVREGRLEDYLLEFSEMEADRPERVDALKTLHAELEARHARQLEETLKRIEDAYLEDKQDWLITEPARKERVYSVLGGQPEKIPDVWETMVY